MVHSSRKCSGPDISSLNPLCLDEYGCSGRNEIQGESVDEFEKKDILRLPKGAEMDFLDGPRLRLKESLFHVPFPWCYHTYETYSCDPSTLSAFTALGSPPIKKQISNSYPSRGSSDEAQEDASGTSP